MLDDETKQKIMELWEGGLTGSQISQELHLTRCSVLGFISRKRNSGHKFERDDKREARRKSRLKSPKESGPFFVSVKKTKEKKPVKAKVKQKKEKPRKEDFVLEVITIPTRDGGIDLFDLKMNSCRFIISPENTPVRYCGHEKERESYCAEHYKICYVPPRKAIEGMIAADK